MRFPEKKWIFAGMLSTIVLLVMVPSVFCETLDFPEEFSAMAEAISQGATVETIRQEATLASQGMEWRPGCWDCHCPSPNPYDPFDPAGYYVNVTEPHHAIFMGGDPNSPYNPNCPDPYQGCFPCHGNYDENCQTEWPWPVPHPWEGCQACHATPEACGVQLELPEQCIDELRGPCFEWLPGGCIEPQTPPEMIQGLTGTVIELNLQQGISNSLDAKLQTALSALDDVNANNDVAAINSLNAFINAVEAQRGNKITNEEADTLIAAAQAIIDNLESQ
jgi:hypothetical protein